VALETAYGKAYQIQTSGDATNWANIYTTTTARVTRVRRRPPAA